MSYILGLVLASASLIMFEINKKDAGFIFGLILCLASFGVVVPALIRNEPFPLLLTDEEDLQRLETEPAHQDN